MLDSDSKDDKMDKAPVSLGPLETQVMQIVWTRGRVTVQEAVDELHSHGQKLAYTTVMTIMARLTAKKVVKRDKAGKAYSYRPVVSQSQFENNIARQLAQQLVRGFDHVAIARFVEEVEKVGPERLAELRALADEAAAKHERQG